VLVSLAVVEANENRILLDFVPEVVAGCTPVGALKKLFSDIDKRLAKGGVIPVAGLEKFTSDCENRLPSELLTPLFVDKPKGKEVWWVPVVPLKKGGILKFGF